MLSKLPVEELTRAKEGSCCGKKFLRVRGTARFIKLCVEIKNDSHVNIFAVEGMTPLLVGLATELIGLPCGLKGQGSISKLRLASPFEDEPPDSADQYPPISVYAGHIYATSDVQVWCSDHT